MRLLRDNEAEVRIAAAGKVTKFCRILSPELAIQHILPCVKVHISLSLGFSLAHISTPTECCLFGDLFSAPIFPFVSAISFLGNNCL